MEEKRDGEIEAMEISNSTDVDIRKSLVVIKVGET